MPRRRDGVCSVELRKRTTEIKTPLKNKRVLQFRNWVVVQFGIFCGAAVSAAHCRRDARTTRPANCTTTKNASGFLTSVVRYCLIPLSQFGRNLRGGVVDVAPNIDAVLGAALDGLLLAGPNVGLVRLQPDARLQPPPQPDEA